MADMHLDQVDPAVIRAEIIRLSARLPKDDPLRIAIACAPWGAEDSQPPR